MFGIERELDGWQPLSPICEDKWMIHFITFALAYWKL